MAKIVHFEGIFGSGKTTSAQAFSDFFNARDLAAHWYLEESHEHPIRPHYVKNAGRESGYAAFLLRAWSEFLAKPSEDWCFLDGYAFQSTVRFLFEHQYSRSDIDDYFSEWVSLGAGRQQLVYLYVESPQEHLKRVVALRGTAWTEKVTAYIEQTPVGRLLYPRGVPGLCDYWERYQGLCVELLASSDLPHVIVPAMSREWRPNDVKAIQQGNLDLLR